VFALAVSAEMVFRDLPVEERVRRIADLGFMVEIWDWTTKDIGALVHTGDRFSSMTGYVREPDRPGATGGVAHRRDPGGGRAGPV
jgi:hydroxypyruvate isomerase